jgi:hypothetical protein
MSTPDFLVVFSGAALDGFDLRLGHVEAVVGFVLR